MSEMPVRIGAAVLDVRGEMLGHVGSVYVDNATGRPAWAAVQLGRHTAVVPLELARFDGASLHVPYRAEQVASAPVHDPATLISYAEGDDLARHYGLLPTAEPHPARPTPSPAPSQGTSPAQNGPARVGAAGDGRAARDGDGDGSMMVSAEQLRVGAVNVVVARARLVTFIVTEDQTFTIPVSRQEVRLVYDPVPAHEQVISDVAPAEETYEVIRHTEQVLFSKQVVPIERVRMLRRVTTTGQTVTGQLRSEQIDLDHLDTRPHTDNGHQPRAGERQWE